VKIRLSRTSDNTRGRIRCLGGVSIPCRPVAPAVNQVPLSWMRSYPLSKSVCHVRSNYWNEKCQTTYGSRKVCNYELDHCNGHRICETPTSNETVEISVLSTCLSVVYPDFQENWLYVEQALAYQIIWEIYTPYAGDSGMLLQVYGKLTMAKLKSIRLSYNWVVSFPPGSIFNKTSKYEAEVDDYVVSFISSSLGYTESTYEWNRSLLIDKTSSMYLSFELKATARSLFFSCRSFWMNSAS
jgi:hypothetical protein